MNLKPELELNQKQNFVLTPQLKTAIEILQYNSIELKEFIDKKIKENPLLEKIDKIQTQYYLRNNYSVNDKEIEYEKFISYQSGLCEYLEDKLIEVLVADEIKIGKFIVGSLNEKGELTIDLEMIAEFFFNRIKKSKRYF